MRWVGSFKGMLAFAAVAIAAAPAWARELPASFADLTEKLSPAVVNISTSQKVKGGVSMFGMPFEDLPDTPEFEPFREFFERFGQQPGQPGQEPEGQEREVYSLGSGFVIDAGGHVITNNHVIDEAEEISVILHDKTKLKAKIIGRDPKTDLALLKVDAGKPLPFVPLGDSDTVRVGDWVLAIGNPFGLGGTVTSGIISARQRHINAGPFDDFLQTDAAINRGNSGGPLFNLNGEVIGITSAIFSPSGGNIGIGFAIPTSLAKPVLAQLKEFGRTHRGWLGVKIQEVNEEVAESLGFGKPMGALVLEVQKDSPAAKAGIQAGDIIVSFDGKEIGEMRHLPRMVAEAPIGKKAPIEAWRKGKRMSFAVTLGELDEEEEGTAAKRETIKKKDRPGLKSRELLGMDLAVLTPELKKEYKIPENESGLIVLEAKKGSDAARKGMRAGDVVTDLNNEPVKSAEEFQAKADSARKAGRKFLLLRVLRGKESYFVTLSLEEGKKEE